MATFAVVHGFLTSIHRERNRQMGEQDQRIRRPEAVAPGQAAAQGKLKLSAGNGVVHCYSFFMPTVSQAKLTASCLVLPSGRSLSALAIVLAASNRFPLPPPFWFSGILQNLA